MGNLKLVTQKAIGLRHDEEIINLDKFEIPADLNEEFVKRGFSELR